MGMRIMRTMGILGVMRGRVATPMFPIIPKTPIVLISGTSEISDC
jgi:hypothetical protein